MTRLSAASTRLDDLLSTTLNAKRLASQFRQRRLVRPIDAVHVEFDGRAGINFGSNNYLGLTHHPRMLQAAAEAMQQYGLGSGAAALVTGHTPLHAAAERAIALWKGTEEALLLPSGYQANHAAVQTLAEIAAHGGGVRFLIDRLAHASLIDAVRGCGCEYRVFAHNDLLKLDRLLDQAQPGQMQVVVTESIFSMDGDAADLAGLADLKARRPFVLLLDEAHASGVFGVGGNGLPTEMNLPGLADVTVMTFSKALGCVGAGICASAAFCTAIVNTGRAYIFSTSLPPAVAGAAQMALRILNDEPQRRQRVRQLAGRVRAAATDAGFSVPNGGAPIIPLIFGDEQTALTAAAVFADAGLLVPAIRPPAVPRGTSRLRITLSCEHTDDHVQQIIAQIQRASLALKTSHNHVR